MLKLGEIADAVAEFRKVIKSSPEDQKLWFRIGQCEESVRNWPGALDAYRRLLKLVPNDPVISSRVAWVLAAAPSDSIRNGGESVALAESAARATDRKNPMVLDVLGAAYAETGEFAKAVRAAEEALKIVLADQKSGFASEIKARLAGYRDGVVYRLPKK